MTLETQLELFREAVDLLGGTRAAAAALDVAERTIYRLVNGKQALHTGFMRDISAALIAHADAARALERRLSPAFSGNLLPGQPAADGRWHRAPARDPGKSPRRAAAPDEGEF